MDKVSVCREDAARLLGLWDACEAAERHFHSCQSAQFRSFVKSVWDAPNMHAAAEHLRDALAAKETGENAEADAGEHQPKNSEAETETSETEGEEHGT